MYSVHSIERVQRDAFALLPGAENITETVEDLWSSGASRPDWCFVVERDGRTVGRAGFVVRPTCPPEFLGDLPAEELFVYGLWLPWEDDDWLDAGTALLREALAKASPELPNVLQTRLNPEWHDHLDQRRAVFETLGMNLFQEKQGHYWRDDGSYVQVPDRLTFTSIQDTGVERYREVLGRCGADTLDRNDRWYRTMAGERNWSGVFMTMLDEENDRSLWLLGALADGEDVGFVAVNDFDDAEFGVANTATVTFIGVLPEHRGNGYINDLLLGGTAAAQRSGHVAILSDVDTLNLPMHNAMERCAHRSDVRTWHIWHHRGAVRDLVDGAEDMA